MYVALINPTTQKLPPSACLLGDSGLLHQREPKVRSFLPVTVAKSLNWLILRAAATCERRKGFVSWPPVPAFKAVLGAYV